MASRHGTGHGERNRSRDRSRLADRPFDQSRDPSDEVLEVASTARVEGLGCIKMIECSLDVPLLYSIARHAPAPRGYRDQYRTHSRPSLRCVERETGLVAGWRCNVCPAFAVTAGTLAPVQHDASRWSAVAQLPGAMRMHTLRCANCQYRTLATSEPCVLRC